MESIQVLLADDHREFRRTLRELLEEEPGIHVVAEADDGRQAVSLARELSPDAILMDVEMPLLDGIQATREIRSLRPGVGVIGLSVHRDRRLVRAMLEAGASGYLSKDEDLPRVVEEIRAAAGRSREGSPREPMSEVGR